MRLPYLQIEVEVIEQIAPDLAVVLGEDEARLGWGLLKLFKWALGRCPEDAPPSHNALVRGAFAAKLIAKAANFDGDAEAFVDACASVRPDPLVERTDEGIRICGLKRYDSAWEAAHNRTGRARAAAEARWSKPSDAQAMPEQCSTDAQAMLGSCLADARPMLEPCLADARAMLGDAKTKTKIETKKEETKETDGADAPLVDLESSEPETTSAADAPVIAVFDHWREKHGHPGAKLDRKRKRLIRAALRLYAPEQLLDAIDGCKLSPFHQGQNDDGRKYDSLELILRNADKIDAFRAMKAHPPQPKSKGPARATDWSTYEAGSEP